MAQFKIGDTVRLKSGSPVMTVTSVQPTTLQGMVAVYATNWFVGTKVEKGQFPEAALEIDDDD